MKNPKQQKACELAQKLIAAAEVSGERGLSLSQFGFYVDVKTYTGVSSPRY